MNVRLDIERLVLDGLPVTARQGIVVRRAAEGELARLLRTGGVPASLSSGGATDQCAGPAVRVSPATTPAALGRLIARSVYHGGVR